MKVRLRYPLRVALLYALLGGLWILVSDRLAAGLFSNSQVLLQVNTYKGWFFIAGTTILLYLGLRREYSRMEQMTVTLRESEKRYHLISENSGDVIWALDLASQKFTYVSPSVFNLRELTPEEVMAEPMQASMTPASFKEVSENLPGRIAEFMSGDQSARTRTTRVDQTRRDGSIVPTEVVTNLITDANGRVVEVLGITRDITERKRVEERVNQLAAIVQFSDDVIIGKTLDGIITSWNRGAEKTYGYTESEMVGQSISILLTSDHEDDIPKILEKINAGEQIEKYETVRRRKDGGEVQMLLAVSPIWDSHGRIVAASTIGHDITARKQAEEAQRQSEILFRSLFELSPDAVVLLDPHDPNVPSRIVDCNAAACLMNGYQRDELIGHSIDIVNAEPYTQAGQAAYLKKLRDEGTLQYEVFHRHKNGVVFPVEISTSFIKVGERELVIGIDRDITERKRAEEKLTYQANLLAHINDAVIASDAEFRLTSWNAAAESLYGWKAEEVLGRVGLEILQTEWPTVDADTMRRSITEQGHWRGEVTQSRKDGSRISIEISTMVLYAGNGQIKDYISITRDISERKQAEQILRESEARFMKVFQASPIGISIFRLGDNRSVDVNDAYLNIVGYTRGEIVGHSAMEIDLFIDADIRNVWMKTLQEGNAVRKQDTRIRRKSGEIRNVFVSIDVIEVNGESMGLVLTSDITERKRTEEALRESEQKFSVIFEKSAFIAVLSRQPDGVLEDVNEAFEHTFGYTRQQALGRTTLDLGINPNAEARARLLAEMKEFGSAHNQEMVLRAKSGEERWFLVNIDLVDISNQKYILNTMQDITERKRAENALRESEEKYRSLVQSIQVGVVVHAPDSGILFSNPRASELLGLTQDQMRGKTAIDPAWCFIQEDETRMPVEEYPVNQALAVDVPISNLILGIVHPDRESPTWVQCNAHQDRDLSGNLQQVVISFADITERKQAEEALRESEERLRLSLRAASQGMYDLNVQTGAAIVNEEYVLMLGHDPETFVETNAAWIERLHPDDKETTAKAYMDYINGVTSEYRVEFRQKTRKGDWKWILSLGKVIEFDADGKPLRMLGTHTDITERKLAEQVMQEYNTRLETEVEQRTHELREAQERLVRQERLATLGQLAGSIGHELRNPLGVISNATYFLKMSQPDAADIVKEYLDIIEKETRASDKIITDLLDFTRIKSMDRQPVSASELIRRTLERYPTPSSVNVTLQIPADLPQIYVDPQHVVQIFGNLVTNAYQAMDGALSKEQELKISVSAEGVMIKIDVQDMGIGIPSENMSKLFEPLFTTKTKGIGLGLAVSRKLSEANGGRIEVESEAGKGSTFTIYLPIYKEFK